MSAAHPPTVKEKRQIEMRRVAAILKQMDATLKFLASLCEAGPALNVEAEVKLLYAEQIEILEAVKSNMTTRLLAIVCPL